MTGLRELGLVEAIEYRDKATRRVSVRTRITPFGRIFSTPFLKDKRLTGQVRGAVREKFAVHQCYICIL